MNTPRQIDVDRALLLRLVSELLGEFSHSLCQADCNDPYAMLSLVGRDNPYARITMADIFRPAKDPIEFPLYIPNRKKGARASDKKSGESIKLTFSSSVDVWHVVWQAREAFLGFFRGSGLGSTKSVFETLKSRPNETPRTPQELIAAQLIACNSALIMLMGDDNQLAAANEIGLSGGLLQECHLLTYILPESEWSESGKSLLRRAWKFRYRDLTQGTITPPAEIVRVTRAIGAEEDPGNSAITRDLNDPTRLLFYLSLPEYHTLLYFDGMENRHEYVLVCFKGAKRDRRLLILDTHIKENAAFAFFGTPEEVRTLLALGQTKLELRASPLFLPPAIIHDPGNRWHNTVRGFVPIHAV